MKDLILVINPGATSSKIGVFKIEGGDVGGLFDKTITHSVDELKGFASVESQKQFRKDLVLAEFGEAGFELGDLACVVGRGGLLKPLRSGTYEINEKMLADLSLAERGEHASNLGAMIAREIASPLNIPSYIVDPVSVDEWEDIARISGLKGVERNSLSHALNTKAVAKRYAKESGNRYEALRLVVAHLGTGVTVSAHRDGRMIDATNPREEGAFCADRSGTLPAMEFAKLCLSGKFTLKDIERMVFREGGLFSYLGTKDLREVESAIEKGDKNSAIIFDAMVYQFAREIGAMAAVLDGRVDAVILTGGMCKSEKLRNALEKKIGFISKLVTYPGEDELRALAEGAFRVLSGEEKALPY